MYPLVEDSNNGSWGDYACVKPRVIWEISVLPLNSAVNLKTSFRKINLQKKKKNQMNKHTDKRGRGV